MQFGPFEAFVKSNTFKFQYSSLFCFADQWPSYAGFQKDSNEPVPSK